MTDTAPVITDQGPQLPSGVHPRDMSVPGDRVATATDSIAPDDPTQQWSAGKVGFPQPNSGALPVFQRASEFWSCGVLKVDANQGSSGLVVGRQKGRTSVTIWVPAVLPDGTVPLGVIIAPTEGEVQQGVNSGIVLNPGDSTTLETEAPVYAGLIPGNTSGACQFTVMFNPPVPVSVDY